MGIDAGTRIHGFVLSAPFRRADGEGTWIGKYRRSDEPKKWHQKRLSVRGEGAPAERAALEELHAHVAELALREARAIGRSPAARSVSFSSSGSTR